MRRTGTIVSEKIPETKIEKVEIEGGGGWGGVSLHMCKLILTKMVLQLLDFLDI